MLGPSEDISLKDKEKLVETMDESKPEQEDLNRTAGPLKSLSEAEPTEESKAERDDSNSTAKVFKDLARIACAFIVFYGVIEGYNRFSLRYDDEVLENSIHQIFTVAEALGYVIITYCFARGIMILFNLDDRGK